MEVIDDFIECTKRYLNQGDITLEDLKSLEKRGKKILKRIKRDVLDRHIELVGNDEIEAAVKSQEEVLTGIFNEKRKKIEKKAEKQKNESNDKKENWREK